MRRPRSPRTSGLARSLGVGRGAIAAGALVQAAWFPGGLLLALAGCAALFYGGGKLTGTRLGAVVPAAVWLVSRDAAQRSRPEGDFLLRGRYRPVHLPARRTLPAVICATLPQLVPSGANRA